MVGISRVAQQRVELVADLGPMHPDLAGRAIFILADRDVIALAAVGWPH